MVRLVKGNHNKVVTGSQDATKQVSKNEWNDGHSEDGMLGFTSQTATITISTGALLATDTLTVVAAETGTSDALDTITTTDTNTEDVILLFADAGDTITVTHAAGGAGQIHLLLGVNKVASETVPILLIRRGADWYEFGGNTGIFPDNIFAVQDEADATKQMLVSLAGATSSFSTTFTFIQTGNRAITFPDATDTLMGKATIDIMTNKSLDANGTGNVITNIGDAEIEAHTSTKITITNKSLLNSSIVYEDEANTYGDFLQTFKDDKLKINSPDDADGITFVNSNQTAERNLTIPVLTGNDTLATIGLANAWGTANQNIASTGKWQEAGVSISPIGVQDFPVPSTAMWASTTNGAGGLTQVETTTNKQDWQVWEFDATTEESVQFTTPMIRNFDNGTVTVTFTWTNASGLTTETVDWGIKAVAVSNDDPWDASWGSEVTTTDTWIAQGDVHQVTSTAVTIGGTPVDADFIQWQISRKVATDDLTGDARLIGVVIHMSLDGATGA